MALLWPSSNPVALQVAGGHPGSAPRRPRWSGLRLLNRRRMWSQQLAAAQDDPGGVGEVV